MQVSYNEFINYYKENLDELSKNTNIKDTQQEEIQTLNINTHYLINYYIEYINIIVSPQLQLIIEASINEFLRDDIVNSLTNIYIN
jgi:hypothetical protein